MENLLPFGFACSGRLRSAVERDQYLPGQFIFVDELPKSPYDKDYGVLRPVDRLLNAGLRRIPIEARRPPNIRSIMAR